MPRALTGTEPRQPLSPTLALEKRQQRHGLPARPHALPAHPPPPPLTPHPPRCRYLHKFKWHHLTESKAYEARVKQDKMRDELAQAKKETSFYLKKVRSSSSSSSSRDELLLEDGDPNPHH